MSVCLFIGHTVDHCTIAAWDVDTCEPKELLDWRRRHRNYLCSAAIQAVAATAVSSCYQRQHDRLLYSATADKIDMKVAGNC